MSASEPSDKHRRDEYDRTRKGFRDMNLEEQATFWVEATASLLARGVQEAGRVLAREMDDFFAGAPRQRSESDQRGPGPAEPETSQQRAPRDSS